MPIGNIKWFDDRKGFGFIDSEGGDVFVHFTAIAAKGYRTLTQGQEVEYDLARGQKGLSALNVRVLKAVRVDPF